MSWVLLRNTEGYFENTLYISNKRILTNVKLTQRVGVASLTKLLHLTSWPVSSNATLFILQLQPDQCHLQAKTKTVAALSCHPCAWNDRENCVFHSCCLLYNNPLKIVTYFQWEESLQSLSFMLRRINEVSFGFFFYLSKRMSMILARGFLLARGGMFFFFFLSKGSKSLTTMRQTHPSNSQEIWSQWMLW